MVLPTIIDEKIAILTATADELLPLFSPLERAVIIALKSMKNERETLTATGHDSVQRIEDPRMRAEARIHEMKMRGNVQ